MTKEITKAIVLQRMEDKLKLREFAAAKFLLDETVVPVYDIQQNLELWRSYYMSTGVITGTGPIPFTTVPDDERWRLRAYSVTFISGAITIAGVYVLRKTSRDAADFSYLDLTAAQSVSYLVTLPEAVVLEPGDKIYANVDGYTSNAVLRLNYDYMMETIR